MNNREAFEAIIKNTAFGRAAQFNPFALDDKGNYFYAHVELAHEVYKACLASQAQQTESQWSPIETAPKNKKIIVRYKNALGKDRTVFAKYLDKFTEEASEGTDCETDYCEDEDTFYCKEGWVELIDNWDDFSSVYFDSRNVPTHWMDIPPAPEGGDK